MDAAAPVGKKGEWTGFDSRLGRLETEGDEGSMVISRAKLGLQAGCHTSMPPQQKWQKRRRVNVYDGKCVVARTKLTNEGVPSVRMAKSKKSPHIKACPITHEHTCITDNRSRILDAFSFETSFITAFPNSPTYSSNSKGVNFFAIG